MCRLFGFRSSVPSKAHRSLLNAENALAEQSTKHPDGWGIGWFVDGDAYVIKSANAAHACDRFKTASKRLTSHTFVVHVRKATVGTVDHLNAHPFRFGRWLFAHNGTIFGMEKLAPWLAARTNAKLASVILGDTDSERLFYYLLSGLIEAGVDQTGRHVPDAALVGRVTRDLLFELDAAAEAAGVERPITNVILTNGEIFVAHRAGMPLMMTTQKLSCKDFFTCPAPIKTCMEAKRPDNMPVNHLIVASEPIGSDENVWEELPDGTTVALEDNFLLSLMPPPDGWIAPELPEWVREQQMRCQA